eukprot:4151084-Ditylum_brightwellii.AAC.1
MAKGKGTPQNKKQHTLPNPMATSIGKLMEPWGIVTSYPRTHRLLRWSQGGVEVDCGPRWSWEVVLAVVTRGPHTSGLTLEAINLVQEDAAYQITEQTKEAMEATGAAIVSEQYHRKTGTRRGG